MSDSQDKKPHRKLPKRVDPDYEEELLDPSEYEIVEPPPRRRSSRRTETEVEAEPVYFGEVDHYGELPAVEESTPEPKPRGRSSGSKEPQSRSKPKPPPKVRKGKSKSRAAQPTPSMVTRLAGFFRRRPKMQVAAGAKAKDLKRKRLSEPLTLWSLMIRLLPMWALLVMVLIIEPALPFRAAGAVINWLLEQLPDRQAQASTEPVYIIENPSGVALQSELPPPNWPLEISPIFTPEIQYWEERIAEWSVAYRIKPNMIATIMQIESCGNPEAVSSAGAQGLFQVMPLHFQAGEDAFEPDTNAGRGMLYLGEMLASANGDTGLAFAAYNGGPSMLYTSPVQWPTETQNYQFWATGIYEDAELGLQESPTLGDWLNAGGYGLCAQAAEALGLAQ